MTSRVKACDNSKQNMVSASALFGAGVVLLAGSLTAAVAAGPAEAKPLSQPYYSYSTKSYAQPVTAAANAQAQAQARTYAAPAKALGDRVARAANQAYTPAPASTTQYASAARSAPTYAKPEATSTPYTDAWNRAQEAAKATGDKLAPTMVFFSSPMRGFAMNSLFGMRTLGKRTRPHEGVDFAAPMGSPVACAAQGRVLRTGNSSSYGRFVEVEHANGVTSFYAHLSAISVQQGAALGAGDTLGKVGTTGHSTGPHLHFEIRRNGQQVDPTGFLGRQFPSQPVQSSGAFLYRIVHNDGGGAAPTNIHGVVAAE
ncbi:M23 family metallopeptidase [Caulobacter sp. 17J80-11]|uniref:M23 family metallopeptidase n=1 Tax=Caulobacter sp. 17J80-11 TaxID=2763502 RepID=UPI001653A4F9|nr:M23 family metallopeptidase [Caulobacter sp. 17J80-11]MBC6980234.1 M23 family metallopeptidase [Caulobacter sp. 17J80-11]